MTPPLADPAPNTDGGLLPPVFCVSPDLGVLAFTGPDAEAFLQGQLSSDLKALAPATVQWSSYNSPKGRMLATLLLWREGQESIRAVIPAELAEPLRKRLSMYVLRSKVSVADISGTHTLVGIGGANAAALAQSAFGRAPDRGQSLVGESHTLLGLPDGRIIAVMAATLDATTAGSLSAHGRAVGPEIWRWLGVRAGVPTIHATTQDQFVLQMANWDLLGGVSFQKGCYPGQEIVARMQYLGKLKERMHLFHVDGVAPLAATRIYGDSFGDQACGTVVDAASAPGGGADLLAVVQLSALDGALRLGAPDGALLLRMPLPYGIPAPVTPDRPKL